MKGAASIFFNLIMRTSMFTVTRLNHLHGRYSNGRECDFMAARRQSSSSVYFRDACGKVKTTERQRWQKNDARCEPARWNWGRSSVCSPPVMSWWCPSRGRRWWSSLLWTALTAVFPVERKSPSTLQVWSTSLWRLRTTAAHFIQCVILQWRCDLVLSYA